MRYFSIVEMIANHSTVSTTKQGVKYKAEANGILLVLQECGHERKYWAS